MVVIDMGTKGWHGENEVEQRRTYLRICHDSVLC